MSQIQKCPVCGGCGKVGYNFYKDVPKDSTITSEVTEICRTCNGLGILWQKSENFNTYQPISDNLDLYNPCSNCPVRQNPNWPGFCNCALPYYKYGLNLDEYTK